jgi:hypothetical protein
VGKWVILGIRDKYNDQAQAAYYQTLNPKLSTKNN